MAEGLKVDEINLNETSKSQAEAAKAEGNAFLTKGMHSSAEECYTKAIALNPTDHVFFSNRSAARLHLGRSKEALEDALECVRLAPQWGKGFSRVGAAAFAVKDYPVAVEYYARGIAMDPTNAALTSGLVAAQSAMKESPAGEENVDPVVGIDLGTTYSCVAVWQDDGVKILPDGEGNLTTPSIVAFLEDGQRLVGWPAKRQAASNAENTVYDVKRILGGNMDDPLLQKDIKRFAYKVNDRNGKPVVMVKQSESGTLTAYTPEQISAMVLGHMKSIAEANLGRPVKRAVITVPAYFNDAQRQATKDAGAIAGLDVLRIINEPTAAALAYGLDVAKSSSDSRNVLVFDLGGGTFDVSLLSIERGIFEVKATAGDTHLGGEDFDDQLLDYAVAEFTKKHKDIDISSNSRAMKRLRVACEQAKRVLASTESTTIALESLMKDQDFSMPLTRAKFDKLNDKLFSSCLDTVKRVLKDAKMDTSMVNDIVLVGGSTRIHKVQQLLQKFFDGKDLCKAINPDEAVAYGAAVQGAIMGGMRHASTQDLLLVDVTPLSLGIELMGNIFAPIIPRNTQIPVKRTRTFTTTENNQTAIDVVIFEGERPSTTANNFLGKFDIQGIERAKAGIPQIEVTFSVNTDGILTVSARDTVTNAEANTSITNNRGRLSEEEVARMVEEAEKYAEEDKLRMLQVEARNELESLLYQAKDRAQELDAKPVIDLCNSTQEWLDENPNASVEKLHRRRDKIHEKFQ